MWRNSVNHPYVDDRPMGSTDPEFCSVCLLYSSNVSAEAGGGAGGRKEESYGDSKLSKTLRKVFFGILEVFLWSFPTFLNFADLKFFGSFLLKLLMIFPTLQTLLQFRNNIFKFLKI